MKLPHNVQGGQVIGLEEQSDDWIISYDMADTARAVVDNIMVGGSVESVQSEEKREEFEAFVTEKFGDTVDLRRARSGDKGYMAWDAALAWIIWQECSSRPETSTQVDNYVVMQANKNSMCSPVSIGRLNQIRETLSKASAQSDGGNLGYAMADAAKVIDMAIASFDAGPVFFIEVEGDDCIPAGRIPGSTFDFKKLPDGINKLYAATQPVTKRDRIRSEHAVWSQTTFGDVGPVGPLKHLSKEALEAAAEPGDLSEWADMQFLLWDAQRRAGISDEQITLAMVEKLAVNKQREWPEPKDGEPRLHIKADQHLERK
jgi:hypothetical protein